MNSFSEDEKREIRLWAQGKRGHLRRTCPHCLPIRKNKQSQCLSATIYHDRVVYKCHHCEIEGAVRLEEEFKPAIVKDKSELNDDVAEFLKSRGISRDTGITFGCIWMKAFFPDLRKETGAIAYNYAKDGYTTGYKLRSLEEKAHVCTKALKIPFGMDMLDMRENKTIIICEGELDCLSYYEAGVTNVVSVPNGAQSLSRDEKGFMWELKSHIDQAERVIIAADNDEAGEKMADELSRRIGRYKCWKIEYPEACKDANDVLMKYSKAKLAEVITNAQPWPISGLYEADHYFDKMDELYEKGFEGKIKTGMENIDTIYSVGKGLLTVVTGIPGNGKSTFVDQLMLNLTRMYGYKLAVCSFENPPEIHISKLAEMLTGKTFFDRELGQKMSIGEKQAAQKWIKRYFYFLQQDDGSKSTVEDIIERVKTAVFRFGVNCVVIDPYNYIERPKSMENETQFIDDMLTRFRLVAMAHDLHIWFVAHPTKMPMDADGKYQIPRGYSISGSSAWYSKPDFGLTVHRSDDGVKIINWKTRYNWLGREGETIILYNETHNSYLCDMIPELLPMGAE